MRHNLFRALFICAIGLLLDSPLEAQSTPAADALAAELGAAGTGKSSHTPEELSNLVEKGLKDPSAREAALLAIVGRGARGRTQKPEWQEGWRAEHKALSSLRPAVHQLLNAEDVPTRNNAVMAAATLGMNPARLPAVELDRETWALLKRTYQHDDSVTVRAEIMKTAALSEGADTDRRGMLLLGLVDPAPGVISQAVRGAARLQMTEMLPKTIELLGHADPRVRLAAAIVLPDYGSAAVGHLPALEAAAANEKEEPVKKTMEGSLAALRRIR